VSARAFRGRPSASGASARPAAVGRGEGSPFEPLHFDPPPTAAPPWRRHAAISNPCGQRWSEDEKGTSNAANPFQRTAHPAAGVGEGSTAALRGHRNHLPPRTIDDTVRVVIDDEVPVPPARARGLLERVTRWMLTRGPRYKGIGVQDGVHTPPLNQKMPKSVTTTR
jgi:hypothetical protein